RLDLPRVLLDRQVRVLVLVVEDPALALGDDVVAELLARHVIAPVAERALGELHDVALVDERHALAPVLERVADARGHEALRTERRDRLDAYAAALADAEAELLDDADDAVGA